MASSTNSPMASRVEATAVNSAPHACPQCSKTFSRLCDLNKHSKSHTRPYKCKDPTCKYHTLGWPTAKELERHYNDKHSANPRIFHCHFPPCPYWSKRESNCKQHMEKAHPYVYVKSKSKGRGLPTQNKAAPSNFSPGDRGTPAGMDHSSSPPSSSPLSFAMPSAGKDFVLFDDDAMGDDDDLYPGYGAAPDAETYLPWTSPTTRLRKNEEFIETFSQTYDGAQEKPSTSTSTGNTGEGSVLSNFPFYGFPNHQQVEDFNQPAGEVPIKVESPVMTFDNVSPRKRKYEAVRAHQAGHDLAVSASTVGQQRSRKARAGQGASTPSGPCDGGSKHGDSGSEDGCRPKKRPKPNPIETFTDTSMPDIFRYAHPDIYDRKRTEKYAPCHTVHREISTLVRHLSRPAHRLKVTERVISSFDTVDEGFRHPRVGLCRSCWETFEDPSAFDDHLSRPCQKVSKGKREKWRILFESFTPLHDSTATGPLDSVARQIEEQQWEEFSSHLDGLPGPDEAKTPPTSVPSPVASQERFISAYEHDKLQREHQALRERHQQLERMTQALLIQRLIQQHTQHATAPEPDVKPLVPDSSKDHRSSNSPATSSDRDSLVQHMNSQSTDVDVYGFMQEMEDTRQTLSRMNSGLSTASRSTIHHVPPSPPSRPAELSRTRNGGLNNNQQVKHPHPHREPLPSIPDSGYGTEQRRGSLGDLPTEKGQAAMTTTRPPTPPSTAEAAQTAMKAGGETLPWEEATPRNNTSSPPHSQPGFLTEQELADYHDDSYNLFFQDNMLQSRSSPLGFTFEFHSQVE